MTEELISKLSRLHDLTVIARTSIMQYKKTGKSIAEIGRRARRSARFSRAACARPATACAITAQLVDVASQGHLWSQDYDRTLDDVFAIQSDVARACRRGVADDPRSPAKRRQTSRSRERKIWKRTTLYLQGLYLLRHSESKEALRQQHRVLRAGDRSSDPAFAEAYAAIAFCLSGAPGRILAYLAARARPSQKSGRRQQPRSRARRHDCRGTTRRQLAMAADLHGLRLRHGPTKAYQARPRAEHRIPPLPMPSTASSISLRWADHEEAIAAWQARQGA